MQKTVLFQTAYLLRGSQSADLPLCHCAEDLFRLSGTLHRIGVDAPFLQVFLLLVRRRTGFPPERRHIAGQIPGLDRHLVLQGVYQPGLPLFHGFQLLRQLGLPVCHHVLRRFVFGFLDVHWHTGLLFQLLCHFLLHFFVLADEARRTAQLVLFRVPQEIQQQKVVFPLCQPCAASHHLAVQGTDFRRTQHHHAVYLRTVPALGEQRTVAQHVVFAVGKVL